MTNQSNKNNRIIQLNNIRFSAVVMALVFLSFSAQAQFREEPADFDRLLSTEFSERSQPTVSNCKTGVTNCAGVIYLQFSPEFSSASELIVRVEARAGQEAIGRPSTPAVCTNAAGGDVPGGTFSAGVCTAVGGAGSVYTPAVPGNIDAANPANIFNNADVRVTYSKDIFPGVANSIRDTGGCTSEHEFESNQVSGDPNEVDTSIGLGIVTYSYDSAFKAQAPTAIAPDNVIQYQTDSYTSLVKLTCSISDVTKLWNMDYHVGMYRNLSQHVGANEEVSYIISPENSLEFFPLDGSNYIVHAEITEDGQGVLIEYAQAVTDNTNQAYTITALDGSDIAITPSITWLNNQTVWLALSSDIYAGVNVAATALDSDRHVLVSSTLPDDTSFEVGGTANFGGASTYRAVLTRHASDADFARTAPTITDIDVADGTGSIDLTFSEAVCGSPADTGTNCVALTADHFEVMYYGETETRALTISSVDVTGSITAGYTDATLTLPSVDIGGNDYLLVRTARNSRFSDQFITDRTIFSQASTSRTIPTTSDPYTEAESGMLHLQSGALVQAIPTITHALTNPDGNSADYSVDEGDVADGSIATNFTVTRTPTGSASTVTVTITRDDTVNSANPTAFAVSVDGTPLVESAGVWTTQYSTFVATGADTKTIEITFTGNDTSNDDYVYEISIEPTTIPGGGSQEITFTITDDERGLTLLAIDSSAIDETEVDNEGVPRRYTRIYPVGTNSDDIIEEVGLLPGEAFTITQIELTVADIGADTADVRHNNAFTQTRNGNVFTFNTGGVAIAVAETFLNSLEFGINSPEPTGGSDTSNVTLTLDITAIATVGEAPPPGRAGPVTRTINEENDDPVVVGPADGEAFTLQNRALASGLDIVTGTANDGGDDSGITFAIDPSTFPSLETANGVGVGTLTLSGDGLLTGSGEFTLTAISDVLLARTQTPLMTELSFGDGRDTETRTITINIVSDNIPPTLPSDKTIGYDAGATSVTLTLYSADDEVGSLADRGNAMSTRDVDYIITIMRLASGDKPMLTLPSITIPAARAIDSEGRSLDTGIFPLRPSPEFLPIRILLTRNDVTLLPGDSYMVDISVEDRADNPAATMYDRSPTFTMDTDGAYDELLVDLDPSADCGTGTDSDGDGVAYAYELHIGTDCNGSVDDYIGDVDPANVSSDVAMITFLSPPLSTTVLGAAGASRYTQIDTGVNCVGANCDNLKAFIVSSGSVGNDSANAGAMVTGICPFADDDSSDPSSCWVDDVDVDVLVDDNGNDTGNRDVGTVPLQWGFNLINWVAADNNGNLILSTSQTQLVYVAPVVASTGTITFVVPQNTNATELVVISGVQFVHNPVVHDPDGDGSVQFLDGVERDIPTPINGNNCDSTGSNPYTYTVPIPAVGAPATVCTVFDDVRDDVVTFGTLPGILPNTDPFYAVGNPITVERAGPGNEVAGVRIEGIVVTDNSGNTVNAVAFGETYNYRVNVVPRDSVVVVEITVTPPELSDEFPLIGTATGSIPTLPDPGMDDLYISIEATIAGSPVTTHMEPYPILPFGSTPEVDDDNDGVPDNNDGGGMDDPLDPVDDDGDSTLLSDRDTRATIEVRGGRISLGNNARRVGHDQAQLDLDGSGPNKDVAGDIGPPMTPPGYDNEGVFEFTVYLPANTNTAYISIPLLKQLEEDKVYYKYIDGVWDLFETDDGDLNTLDDPNDGDDAYYSAPINSDGVTCPPPALGPQWESPKNELSEGHECVLLVIKDFQPEIPGNFNDSDGQLNGIIVDPGAPGTAASLGGPPSRGGGGAADLWFLLMLLGLIAVPVLTRQRKRLTR